MFKLIITFRGRGPFIQWFSSRDVAYKTLDVYMATALVTSWKVSIEQNTPLSSKKLQLV